MCTNYKRHYFIRSLNNQLKTVFTLSKQRATFFMSTRYVISLQYSKNCRKTHCYVIFHSELFLKHSARRYLSPNQTLFNMFWEPPLYILSFHLSFPNNLNHRKKGKFIFKIFRYRKFPFFFYLSNCSGSSNILIKIMAKFLHLLSIIFSKWMCLHFCL